MSSGDEEVEDLSQSSNTESAPLRNPRKRRFNATKQDPIYTSMNSAADSLQQLISKQGKKSSNLPDDVASWG